MFRWKKNYNLIIHHTIIDIFIHRMHDPWLKYLRNEEKIIENKIKDLDINCNIIESITIRKNKRTNKTSIFQARV